MTHWYLSPHPDDAALSCGGQIATLTRKGERVVVITVFAGDPPDDFQPTPFVEELWTRWGLGRGKAATAARREEDKAAIATLGAELVLWDAPEAIYRRDPQTGQALYSDVNAIFGSVQPTEQEPEFADRLDIRPGDTLHTPLSVGNHVDHQLTARQAAKQSMAICFYEDFPYSLKGDEQIAEALQNVGLDRTRRQSILHPIDSAALDVKIAAIACYRSQISSFWNNLDEMAQSVRNYTAQVGGEREWQSAWNLVHTPSETS